MSKSERKHLAFIEKRLDYLVAFTRAHPDDTALHWRKEEIAALRWVLRRIADIEREELADARS